MKNLQKYMMMGALALAVGFTSCSDDEEDVVPTADLASMNFSHEPGAGEITLKWDVPAENPGFMYMTMVYTDPRDKVTRTQTISPYTEEIVIPNTRARYGSSYSFTFTPYSETDTPGKSFVLDNCKSNAAPATTTVERVPISILGYSTKAQEPSEGPLKDMFDGNRSTFFHSAWSVDKGPNHWVTVELEEALTRFEIATVNRNGGGSNPSYVKLYKVSSLDQAETDLEHPFYEYEHKNRGSGGEFTKMCPEQSEPDFKEPVKFLRYLAKGGNSTFWHLAEFDVNKVILHTYDPETDEEEVE